jgi:hypothetical protein
MKIPKSKIGWVFAFGYLFFAAVLFYKAMTCRYMLCDLEAWPVIIPAGIICLLAVKALDSMYFFGTSYTNISLANLSDAFFFILPTVIGNMICYYWLGVLAARIYKKIKPNK